LLPEVANDTALPHNIPVSPAIHDQYAAVLGCAAAHSGDLMLGTGTAWVLLATVPRLAPPVIDDAFVSTHVVPGLYGQLLSLVNGGSSLTWALELTASNGDIDHIVQNIPPGSEGLRFWPLLAAGGGTALPPGTPGRLDGLRLSHKAPHLLLAVLEGLACELNRYLRFLTDAGVHLQRLVMTGAAAASKITPQILANVTGLPVACAQVSETSSLGAAIIARGILQPNTPLQELSESMACTTTTVQPDANRNFYQDLFQQYVVSLPTEAPRTRSP
jgi:sugar (pentulose or hexulose) kinase